MKKDEEYGGTNPYHCTDKTSVLQEARVFNETPVAVKKSSFVLTKVLYLLNQGHVFSAKEATDVFFAMTKLFQSNDHTLRRLVYLGIKELCCMAEHTIIVTSSLTKDMNGREDQYRAPAIRALCRITDPSMLQQVERYMKQAIVDRNHAVSSAALVSCRHIHSHSPDMVKRQVAEVTEQCQAQNMMVQYHALGLLYQIRKTDKLAVTKLVSKMMGTKFSSVYAWCQFIRIVARLIEDGDSGIGEGRLIGYLESQLRNVSEFVMYEAANALVSLSCSNDRDLSNAISVLQLFLSSPRAHLRFAAVRTLGKVALTHPTSVTACNLDLENLLQDVNRSIATLAITTLLKTGSENSIDRLMRSISAFLQDISDEFKVVVVEALRSLALQYPKKQGVLMGQLADMLRSEGGLAYKEAIAGTIITIIEDNGEAKEKGLDYLCEFIEDCEHTTLAVRILHLLGKEGPRTARPQRYIRFIYNRVLLENPAVRAAAVSVLARFGATVPRLLPNVLVLLQRCRLDCDDEVRDRSTYYHALLSTGDAPLIARGILNPPMFALPSLERALINYLDGDTSAPFDPAPLPTAAPTPSAPASAPSLSLAPAEGKASEGGAKAGEGQSAASKQSAYADQLAAVPAFAKLGPLFKSSQPIELTESETEYVVVVVKHTFARHVVLQFDATNTLNDQLLEQVTVQLTEEEDEDGPCFPPAVSLPLASLPYGTPAPLYCLLTLPDDPAQAQATFSASLRFTVRDCDPTTGEPETEEGYADDYTLEDVEIAVCDHVAPSQRGNFAAAWEELGPTNEVADTFALGALETLADAVAQVTTFLGMHPCDRSDRVPEGKSSHTLTLAGTYRGGSTALVQARLALTPPSGVTMQLTVRSSRSDVSEVIASAVG